jgi:ribonuclease T2
VKTLQSLFTVLLVLLFTTAGFAQESCHLSSNLPQPHHPAVDWKNPTAPTDYYALTVSWSPQFCALSGHEPASQFQCVDNHFGFVVHGLWPQSRGARNERDNPRYCKTSELLSEDLIKQHLCTVPGVDLIQGEWEKHGTCAFATPESYYARIEALWGQLHKPDLHVLFARRGRNLTAGDVQNAFVAANQAAGLKHNDVVVHVASGNYLQEVIICYNKDYRFQTCSVRGTPPYQRIRVRF